MAYTTVDKSTLHFTPKIYTGNNGASLTISGLNFKPDLTWVKARTASETHGLYDIIRGALYRLQSNSTNASTSTAGTVTGWTSDGFSLGTSDEVNGTYDYVSWNWLGNGSGASNTDGDITSTVSANTTSGFSIIKFTGNSSTSQSFGHGLNGTPKIWFIKNISVGGDNWQVYIDGRRLKLDTTEAAESNYLMSANSTTITTPSSGGAGSGNYNGQDFLVYAFQNIQGFSQASSFTGNGNTDGPFIYTGFKPAWVMVKEAGVGNWIIKDNKRPAYNQNNTYFFANASDAESSASTLGMDLLSNGFKLRATAGDMNGSGTEIFYMAFAEAPLVGSNNVPANAE